MCVCVCSIQPASSQLCSINNFVSVFCCLFLPLEGCMCRLGSNICDATHCTAYDATHCTAYDIAHNLPVLGISSHPSSVLTLSLFPLVWMCV